MPFIFKPQKKIKEGVHKTIQRKRSISQSDSISSESTSTQLKKTKMIRHETDKHYQLDNTLQSTEKERHKEEMALKSSESTDNPSIPPSGYLISRQEIREHRMTSDELDKQTVMKSYTRGEPSCILYVKNLAKRIVEPELRQLFGNYCDDPKNSER